MRSTRSTPGLRNRNGQWYANKICNVGGRRVKLYQSLQTRDYKIAESKLLKLERDLVENHVRGVAEDVFFSAAAARYLDEYSHLRSIVRAAWALHRLVPEIGHMTLRSISDEALLPYKQKRFSDGVTASTINKELSYVRRILTLAARKWRDNGLPLIAAAPLLTDAVGETRSAHILTRAEEERLMSELPEHLRDAMVFAVNTGLRSSEQAGLKWADEQYVEELGRSVFVVKDGKTKNSTRVVPVNDAARSVIDRQRGKHQEYVFTFDGQPVSRFNNGAFRKARSRAGLSDLTWHALRHCFAHRLRASQVPMEDRAALLGHAVSNGEMTVRYSAPEIGILIDHVDRLADEKRDIVLTDIGQTADKKTAAHLTNA